MAWYDEINHVTVCSSIPVEVADAMDLIRGKYNRSRYIRNLIEADIAAHIVEDDDETSESAA